MGILKKYSKGIISAVLSLAVVIPLATAHAGHETWESVPAENKANAKAFYLSLREEGMSAEVAAAMTTRGNSESGFNPFLLQGGQSGWDKRLQAPEGDSSPAYGFLQMQDRRPSGRLGKMLAFVEQFEGGKGTSDPIVSSKAQAKAVLAEFKGSDAFATFTVRSNGNGSETYNDHDGVITRYNYSDLDIAKYGAKEPVNSFEKFKSLKDVKIAYLVWTMSVVRPGAEELNRDAKRDLVMAEAMLKEFGGLSAGSSESGDKVDADLGNDGLPKEWELVGMTKRKYLYESQNKIELPNGDSGLSVKQRQHLASIKEDVTAVDGFNLIVFLRTLVAFVGILFFAWAIFLIVAYLFDRSNIFFEISLVSILTMGSITVMALDESDARRANTSLIARRAILSLVIGYVLVAGVMYSGLDWLLQLIQSWISKV